MSIFKIIGIIGIIAIGVFLILFLLIFFIERSDWKDNCSFRQDAPRISFKTFYTLYNINPDKWDIKDYYVVYIISAEPFDDNIEYVYFETYRDYLKFLKFKKDLKKEKYEKRKKVLLKYFQKDIINFRKENEDWFIEQQKKINEERRCGSQVNLD